MLLRPTPEDRDDARLLVAEHIAYLMAHYDIPETTALKDILADPDWHPILRMTGRGHNLPAVETLRNYFRRSRIEPHANTHVTDGLSPKQLELFNLLKNHMHPRDAKAHAAYFIQ